MPKDQFFDDQSSPPAVRNFPAQRSTPRFKSALCSSAGFTLIELIAVCGIIAVLAMLLSPIYDAFVQQTRGARAKAEVRVLETEIADYQIQYGIFPANLAAINRGTLTDPWGNAYVYSTTLTRNRFAVLLNSDYDLYSKGRDGLTEAEVFGGDGTGKDDILRGGDGAFLGFGEEW